MLNIEKISGPFTFLSEVLLVFKNELNSIIYSKL